MTTHIPHDEVPDAGQRDAKTVAQALADAEADPDDDPYAPVVEEPLKEP